MTTTPATETTRDITSTIIDGKLFVQFRNGQTITIDPSNMPDEMNAMARLHGYKQKIVDAAALSRNTDTGATASIEDKYQASLYVYERLVDGNWNKPRESGEPRGGLLFAALCRLYPTRTPDELKIWLGDKSKKQQAELRANPRIARVIDEIRAEASNITDTDSMLDELDN